MVLSPAFPGHSLCCGFLAVCWTKEFVLGTHGLGSVPSPGDSVCILISAGICWSPEIYWAFSSLFPFLPQLHWSNWFLLFPILWFFSGKYWKTLHVCSISFWSNFKDCKPLFLLNCSTGYGNTINIWSAQHNQDEQDVWKAKVCFKQSIWQTLNKFLH